MAIEKQKSRRYFIKTYGCQMNVGDSGSYAGILEAAGYEKAEKETEADIILVNTCVVRQGAEDRAAWYITSMKNFKLQKPNLKIGVCGCIVTEPGRSIEKNFPHVDIFIPPSQTERLVEFLRLTNPAPKTYGEGTTAWITIMRGCDNFCSYCIVPYVRGREESRPIREIIEEIKWLEGKQYREVYLLGQNVNSYKYGLAKLLYEVESLMEVSASLRRLRFMTSHPRDMSEEIINAVAELPHICEFFHLPIQHGDDAMLKNMNRGYTLDEYRKLIEKIRVKIPEAAITSDVIVGYPGEAEAQFENTLKIIEEIGFDACNTLAYSHRPGTAASKLPDDIPEEIKQERLHQAMKVVDAVALKRNEKLVGSIQEILVEKNSPPRSPSLRKRGGWGEKSFEVKQAGGELWVGRTRTNKIVKFSGSSEDLIGQMVKVKITGARSWVLEGELV